LTKVSDLENRINSVKDQILRITRLIEQDNKEKENFIKQTDNDIDELEERVTNFVQQERHNIKITIDQRYLECENKIKSLLEESRDNKEELKNKLLFVRERIEVKKFSIF